MRVALHAVCRTEIAAPRTFERIFAQEGRLGNFAQPKYRL